MRSPDDINTVIGKWQVKQRGDGRHYFVTQTWGQSALHIFAAYDNAAQADVKRISNRYVLIAGRSDAGERGHLAGAHISHRIAIAQMPSENLSEFAVVGVVGIIVLIEILDVRSGLHVICNLDELLGIELRSTRSFK